MPEDGSTAEDGTSMDERLGRLAPLAYAAKPLAWGVPAPQGAPRMVGCSHAMTIQLLPPGLENAVSALHPLTLT